MPFWKFYFMEWVTFLFFFFFVMSMTSRDIHVLLFYNGYDIYLYKLREKVGLLI
jgi:hypothetical protein